MLTTASTRRRAAALASALLLLSAPSAAEAFGPEWTSLPGLTAAAGPDWIRDFETDAFAPTTIYAGTEGDGVQLSRTAGVSWSALSDGLETPAARHVRALLSTGQGTFAGTQQGVFKLAGTSWVPVGQGGGPGKLDASVQALLSIDGTLIAGTFAGGVHRSTDGGQTWMPPGPGSGMPAGETVWSLQSFASYVLAATSSGIYRSLDGGVTWSPSSDGIPPGTVVHRVFRDDFAPSIWYAGTGSGVYRSLNAGLTWSSISDGLPAGGNGIVRDMRSFASAAGMRLYAATGDGVHTALVRLGSRPGEVTWREVAPSGLGSNTSMWALSGWVTPTGTLLAGTQSNGGYGLTFVPPFKQADPTLAGTAKVGRALTATPGRWGGTSGMTYAFAWERCSLPDSLCDTIEGAEEQSYLLTEDDHNAWVRAVVTVRNGAQSFDAPSAESAGVKVGGPEGALPGDTTTSAPLVTIDAPGDASLPEVGDVARVTVKTAMPNQTFNPNATTVAYEWLRCDELGGACAPIAGAPNAPAYTLRTEDAGGKVRVRVRGANRYGTAELVSANATNVVIPDPAAIVAAPALTGTVKIGETLVGSVGAWKSPKTTWERQWESCDADGASCTPIQGAKGAAYVVQSGDAGRRLRMRVRADVNEASRLPGAVEAHTPLTEVVAGGSPPVDPPGGRQVDTPLPPVGRDGPRPPAADRTAPRLRGVALSAARLRAGARRGVRLRWTLSEKATLRLTVVRTRGGRPHGRALGTIVLRGRAAGRGAAALRARLGRRALAPGAYRLTVVPVDAAGNRGAARALAFRVVRR